MQARDYDLVVIGSGPAGEKGAAQVAYFGKKVAIIEREPVLGGASANTGTLPSKTLRETAVMLSGLRTRNLYGADLSLRRRATAEEFLYRKKQVVEHERKRLSDNIRRHNIDVIAGEASFLDAHTVQVIRDGQIADSVRGKIILIATGSSPRRPELFPYNHSRVYDSDTILALKELPQTLGVVGAGVIGCEYACTFAALGSQVVLIDGRAELLDFVDDEISALLKKSMQALGITFRTPEKVLQCDAEGECLRLELSGPPAQTVDALLIASGREANTHDLGLERAGVVTGKHGVLAVDGCYRTNIPHIYAAGDVIGFPALASTAMEQARLAMVHAFDLKYKTSVAEILPYGLYTIPEVSMAGETEEALKKEGVNYVVGRATYFDNLRGMIIGDEFGLLKLLFRREDMTLLGVHVIGENASEVVHVGLMALMVEADAELFIRTCFNYPTLGQMYKYATYDAMGQRKKTG